MTTIVSAKCPRCGKRGKALSYCTLCGEFILVTVALAEESKPAANDEPETPFRFNEVDT